MAPNSGSTPGGLTLRDLRSAIIFGALVYLAIRFISLIADLLLVLSVSVLFAVVLDPAVTWLEKHRIPRPLSAGALALLVIAGLVGIGFLVIPPAGRELAALWRQAPDFAERARDWLDSIGAAGYLPKRFDVQTTKELVRPLLSGVSKVTATAAGTVAGLLLVFISAIYILANPKPLAEGFKRSLRPDLRPRAEAAAQRLAAQIRAWSHGILIGMLVIFALTWAGLSVIGIGYAFLFALIAGLLEAVPVLGPVLSAVPPTVVALIENPILAVWVLALFVVIQQFEGNVLIPIVMSRQLSLHPVTVIFAILVMGGLFGIVGIFLATPAAAAAGIVYDELYLKGRTAANDDADATRPED